MNPIALKFPIVKVQNKAAGGASFWIRASIYPNAFPQPEFDHTEGNEVGLMRCMVPIDCPTKRAGSLGT